MGDPDHHPAARVLAGLEGVRATGRGTWIACCKAHDDSTPSLSIRELEDGRLLLHCFGGCGTHDVVAALGLELHDLFPPQPHDNMRRPRERRPFSAADALRLIDAEVQRAALLLAVCASTPEQITPERRARLMRAASSIRSARQACGLPEVA